MVLNLVCLVPWYRLNSVSDVSDVIDDGSSVVGGRSPKAFHHARTNFSSTDVDVSLCTMIKNAVSGGRIK